MQEKVPSFQREIFNALLFYASNEGRGRLPTIEEALALEIIAGIVDHVSGSDAAACLPNFRDRKGIWEYRVNQIMSHTLEQKSSILPSMRDSLLLMTRFEFCHDHGEKWWETPIRHYLMYWNDCNKMSSTFALTVPFVEETKQMLAEFRPEVAECCRAIGAAMWPYVANDLATIKQYYYW